MLQQLNYYERTDGVHTSARSTLSKIAKRKKTDRIQSKRMKKLETMTRRRVKGRGDREEQGSREKEDEKIVVEQG